MQQQTMKRHQLHPTRLQGHVWEKIKSILSKIESQWHLKKKKTHIHLNDWQDIKTPYKYLGKPAML